MLHDIEFNNSILYLILEVHRQKEKSRTVEKLKTSAQQIISREEK